MAQTIITAGSFESMDSKQIRFLYEIAKNAEVHVLLFADELRESITGSKPKFPLPERLYYVESIRYVKQVCTISDISQLQNISQVLGKKADVYCSMQADVCEKCRKGCEEQGIKYKTISDSVLSDYPEIGVDASKNSPKKVIVTGCFDWFHTGHIRFFEEASEYGDLYVVVGHDKNIEALKGPGHPMFKEDQRRFICGSIRFVKQALISSGDGYLDAEPEMQRIKPDRYVVNEDGSTDSKREYCQEHGIEYIVLKRKPKPGLQRRNSTNLRGY